jgi:hypothetical protein
MQRPRVEDPYPLLELPVSAEQRALDERSPPEPVRISLGWRIVGWIVNIVTGLAGG